MPDDRLAAGHPGQRQLRDRLGSVMTAATPPPPRDGEVQKFWSRVQQQGDCWVWTGTLDGTGYGVFCHAGKRFRSHRYSYELMVAEIPAGLVIDHLCRNRACCNPWHLEPVTEQVNIIRGIGPTAINAAKTECPQGHAYSPDNVYVDRSGYRYCRQCRSDRRPPAERVERHGVWRYRKGCRCDVCREASRLQKQSHRARKEAA